MLVFMGLPIAPSAQAAATGTVSLSSSQIFGNASLSITVADSDIGVQELKDTYNPSIVIEFTNATKSYQINSTQNTGGSWVAYITNAGWVRHSCSAATTDILNVTASDIVGSTGDAVTYPTNKRPNAGFATEGNGPNGVVTGTCATAYVKNHHLISGVPSTRTYSNMSFAEQYATGDIAEFGYIQAFNMTRGNTYTITYKDASDSTGAAKDVSTTFTYKETKATLYNTEEKQTTVTPGATLRLYLDNPDANQDPTEKESFLVFNNTNQFKATIVTSSNATLQNLTNKTLNYLGSAAAQGGSAATVFRLNFTETGVNTGIFKCENTGDALTTSVCLEMENFRYNTSAVGNGNGQDTGADDAKRTHGQNIWNHTSDNSGTSTWKDGDTVKLALLPVQDINFGYHATTCSGARAYGDDTITSTAYGTFGSCYNSTSLTLTITETSGTMTTSASTVTSSTDVTVEITDADMNHDPLVKDTITRVYVEHNDSAPIDITATETGVNSSVFKFTIRNTIGAYDSGCSYSTTTNRLTCTTSPATAPNSVLDLKYEDKYVGTIAASTITFASTAPSISTDKTSYDESAASIKLTLTAPNGNDNSAAKEQILFNATSQKHYSTREGTTAGDRTCSGIFVGSTCSNKRLANFTITKINGTNGYHDASNHTQLVLESGVNTGVWTTSVSISSLRTSGDGQGGQAIGLAAGDQVRFTVKDLFAGGATHNVTVTIGGTVGELSFDRADFPMTVAHASSGKNYSRVNATVTLTDVDKNTNVNARDNATLRMLVKNATGEIVGTTSGGDCIKYQAGAVGCLSWYNVTAQETGINTGIFTFKFGVNWGESNTDFPTVLNYSKPTQEYHTLDRMQDMVGGQICFEWADGASSTNITIANSDVGVTTGNSAVKGVAKCLDIKAHDASISSTISTGKLGDTFTVTATEADFNRDVGVKDTISMLMIGTAKQTAPAETDSAKYNTTVTLTETGVNTGEFTKTITLEPGKSPFGTTLAANQYIRLRIRDNATSNSFYSGAGLARASVTSAITVESTTATLAVSPSTEVGPDGKLYVKLVDPDLMTTAASSVQLTQVTSNGTGDIEKPYASNGTTATGTYWFGITMARSTGTPTDEDGTLHVNASDTIYFYYSDAADVSGTLQVVKASLTVKTESGAITTDKANYLVGDFAEITVVDLDANTSPDTKQSITVKVITDSWEIGTSITLQETAADSNTFTGKIEFIATSKGVPSSSQVSATVGDTVTIKYTDTLCDNNKKCTLEVTTKIGQALSKTEQVPAGTPEIVDTAGEAFASPSVGDIVIVQASVTNDDDVAHTVTFLVQIKNSAGEVVNLGWVRDIELAADESQTPGLSWLPDSAGTYTAEVYVWTSISEAEALSPVKSVTFTIA
jgi:mannose/fructose/N-acetylgalactosamine-specific phosphotransferase system component IIB